jgi:hypothetical protein
VIRPSTMKLRVDPDGAKQNRRVFTQVPAREAAELPDRRRRTPRSAEDAKAAFREMLEGGAQ